MAAQASNVKNRPLPDNDSTLPSSFDSPVYDMAETVPRKNQGSDPHYEMDNMYSVLDHGTPRSAAAQDYETVSQRGSQPTTREAKNTPKHCWIEYKVLACIFITIAVVVALILLICIIILFVEVLKLKQTGSSQQLLLAQQTQNASSIMLQLQMINQSISSLAELVHSEKIRTNEKFDQLVFRGQHQFNPADSCATLYPSSPSGYYWVLASNGSAVRVYCDMTRSCGGVTGGWMRVAELDYSNDSIPCPSGLVERMDSGIRTCGIQSPQAACPSVLLSTSGIEYSQVCGKVLAYQFHTPDGFRGNERDSPTIDSNYVDGVSLTHGTPREHIWTFAAEHDECVSDAPCFIRQDYFCDSGRGDSPDNFFNASPLWDGSGCSLSDSCCSSLKNPPWFHKQLPSPGPTSDDIEMRVCCDQHRGDEDIAMSSVQIYTR